MVKSISAEDLLELTRKHPLVVVLFRSKACELCKAQEKELHRVEKILNSKNLLFVKMKASEDTRSRFGVETVPSIIMWLSGQQVAFQWEPNGVQTHLINKMVTAEILIQKITFLLKRYL